MTPTCRLGNRERPAVEITATRQKKRIEVRFRINVPDSLYLSTVYYKLLRSNIVIRGRHLTGFFKTVQIGGILERYLSRSYNNREPKVEFTIHIPIGNRFHIHSLKITNPSEGLEEGGIRVK